MIQDDLELISKAKMDIECQASTMLDQGLDSQVDHSADEFTDQSFNKFPC